MHGCMLVLLLLLQDDVDADDGEDEDEDVTAEDDEYMKRLRKEALRMLKGETGAFVGLM